MSPGTLATTPRPSAESTATDRQNRVTSTGSTHNSPGSNSQLSHDLHRNGNVSAAGSQRSRSLSSSSQYPPNTVLSPPVSQIGSSTMPLSGHQRSSTVRTPISEKNVVHAPTRKKSTSSSKKQKNSPVVVPTSVRNGHDPRVLVPTDHQKVTRWYLRLIVREEVPYLRLTTIHSMLR